MANFEAVTSCNGIVMKEGIKEYLDKFKFLGEDINVGIDNECRLEFHGYSWPEIYLEKDEDESNNANDLFFSGLKKFVPKGKTLIIQSIGHEKCRFPLFALEIKITSKTVKYVYFD